MDDNTREKWKRAIASAKYYFDEGEMSADDFYNLVSQYKKESKYSATCSEQNKYFKNSKDNERAEKINCTFKNGDSYVGEWKDGRQHGHGISKSVSGHVHEGEWKDGRQHGHGTFTYDGDKFIGEFKEGEFFKGTMTLANGDKYTGEWKDGKYHGNGTFSHSSGVVGTGEFKNGHLNGFGTIFLGNGDKFTGEFKNSECHGYGTYTYANGKIQKGSFLEGIFSTNISRDNANDIKKNSIANLKTKKDIYKILRDNLIKRIVDSENEKKRNEEIINKYNQNPEWEDFKFRWFTNRGPLDHPPIWYASGKPEQSRAYIEEAKIKLEEIQSKFLDEQDLNKSCEYLKKIYHKDPYFFPRTEEGKIVGISNLISILKEKKESAPRQLVKEKNTSKNKTKESSINNQEKNINFEKIYDLEEKGAEYQGQVVNGKPHGKGTWTAKDGKTWIGSWINGVKNGMFTVLLTDGESYSERWDDGELIKKYDD